MSSQISAGMVIYVKDIARVSDFYAAVAGLSVTEEDEDYIVLESETFQLVILAMPAWLAADTLVTDPPERRESTPIKPVFVVRSIEAARSTTDGLGGMLNGSEREWRFQSWRLCDGQDPEGNVFQLRQPD